MLVHAQWAVCRLDLLPLGRNQKLNGVLLHPRRQGALLLLLLLYRGRHEDATYIQQVQGRVLVNGRTQARGSYRGKPRHTLGLLTGLMPGDRLCNAAYSNSRTNHKAANTFTDREHSLCFLESCGSGAMEDIHYRNVL